MGMFENSVLLNENVGEMNVEAIIRTPIVAADGIAFVLRSRIIVFLCFDQSKFERKENLDRIDCNHGSLFHLSLSHEEDSYNIFDYVHYSAKRGVSQPHTIAPSR